MAESMDPVKSADSGSQVEHGSLDEKAEMDIMSYYERSAGRLVLDPVEAEKEFGPATASRLKLTSDGTKILWPQPTDRPDDPQNWSSGRKAVVLAVITLAAIVPDFDGAIAIAGLFSLAETFHTTTEVINNLTSNWSVFLIGWGGLFAVALVRRFGRLPVIFWSQLVALVWIVVGTCSPNLNTFAAMRCLNGFFATVPQVTGLYVVTDMFPFHLQARKLNIWTLGFIVSPYLSPFALGFLAARSNWRWAYAVGCIYSGVVLILIVLFLEETMFDRTIRPIPPKPSSGLRYRVETLVGVTGARMARYRASWGEAIRGCPNILWRPHILGILTFEAVVFGFSIGINFTNPVFLSAPPPKGAGYPVFVTSGLYATPIVAVIIGELAGRYMNDAIMLSSVRRNNGVFRSESRLWACYVAVPLYVCGMVILGAAFQKKLSLAAVIIGWGIIQINIMINTVAVYAYCNDSFPRHQGEVSALLNLARSLGGFTVAYFQVPWAEKHGALQVFGCEAAIVAGLFVLIVPALQWKGQYLREHYGLH